MDINEGPSQVAIPAIEGSPSIRNRVCRIDKVSLSKFSIEWERDADWPDVCFSSSFLVHQDHAEIFGKTLIINTSQGITQITSIHSASFYRKVFRAWENMKTCCYMRCTSSMILPAQIELCLATLFLYVDEQTQKLHLWRMNCPHSILSAPPKRCTESVWLNATNAKYSGGEEIHLEVQNAHGEHVISVFVQMQWKNGASLNLTTGPLRSCATSYQMAVK